MQLFELAQKQLIKKRNARPQGVKAFLVKGHPLGSPTEGR